MWPNPARTFRLGGASSYRSVPSGTKADRPSYFLSVCLGVACHGTASAGDVTIISSTEAAGDIIFRLFLNRVGKQLLGLIELDEATEIEKRRHI